MNSAKDMKKTIYRLTELENRILKFSSNTGFKFKFILNNFEMNNWYDIR